MSCGAEIVGMLIRWSIVGPAELYHLRGDTATPQPRTTAQRRRDE